MGTWVLRENKNREMSRTNRAVGWRCPVMDDVTSMYYSDMLLARLGSRLVGLLATRREADEGRKLGLRRQRTAILFYLCSLYSVRCFDGFSLFYITLLDMAICKSLKASWYTKYVLLEPWKRTCRAPSRRLVSVFRRPKCPAP